LFNLKQIYKKREAWVHKGQFGKLLIVAGSNQYTGSPWYNAMSALRAGVDLVYIIAPERVSNILATVAPEMITVPYEGKFLTRRQTSLILKIAKERRATALVMGGGLGREKETFRAVREIVKKINLPMVLDADAIRASENNWQILKDKKAVLTPHADEFRQLTGDKVEPNFDDRKEKVKKWAKKIGVPILLKGHIDIASNGNEIYLNRGGDPRMSKGGFGDTLAGICGALLARGVEPFEALCAATYINGKAGELACDQFGEGVLASDIFEFIPKIIYT
jgi:NAD(P)H-hydrate epimerase